MKIKALLCVVAILFIAIYAVAQEAGTFSDLRNKKDYKTIKIGNQTWMAENLNFNTSKSWCYENRKRNCKIYGRLYTYDAAMSACPTGWHLPSDSDWTALIIYVGSDVGTKLKSASGWNETGNGTDTYGFTALPGGSRFSNGTFGSLGGHGYFWSSTQLDGDNSWLRYMNFNNGIVEYYYFRKNLGFSVRCIKDL